MVLGEFFALGSFFLRVLLGLGETKIMVIEAILLHHCHIGGQYFDSSHAVAFTITEEQMFWKSWTSKSLTVDDNAGLNDRGFSPAAILFVYHLVFNVSALSPSR